MTHESVEEEARRYLAEGRLVVIYLLGDRVAAVCMGQGGPYDLGHSPGKGWFCSRSVRSNDCCHLRALWLITLGAVHPLPRCIQSPGLIPIRG